MKVGNLVVKIAGRDAGKRGAILNINGNKALIDGEVRRREVSLSHLEPLHKTISVNENASHEEVVAAFKLDLGLEIKESKTKESKPRPRRVHKIKQKPVKVKKAKVEKKERKVETAKPKAEKKTQTKTKFKEEASAVTT